VKQRDCWAEWLAERRFGGDEKLRAEGLAELGHTREEVLDNARLAEGEALLDVGCGEGLIAFGALERGAGQVVFSDISSDLLDACRELAGELGVLERCRFVPSAADDLAAIEDASVDVVTTRSVLIFVERKQEAFREFFRVLRPGGRISIWEPINRFGADARVNESFWGYDAPGLDDLRDRLNALYAKIQPETDPMLDFDERDLLAVAEEAGFGELHLVLRANVAPIVPRPWSTFVNVSGNPKVPTLAEAMDRALTADERERLTEHLRPLIEAGRGTQRRAIASLWAVKR